MSKEYKIGDSYWFVDSRLKIYQIKICSGQDFDKGIAQFDTKEEAEKYVSENKKS